MRPQRLVGGAGTDQERGWRRRPRPGDVCVFRYLWASGRRFSGCLFKCVRADITKYHQSDGS